MSPQNNQSWTSSQTQHSGFDTANETSTAPLTWVVYETTNTITGETYGGVFSYKPGTAKGEYKYNKYIGQGITWDGQAKLLKPTAFVDNVAAYGYYSFQRRDLAFTTCEEEAYELEAELVDEQYVDDTMTLNQRQGGKNGKLGIQSRKRKSVLNSGAGNPNAKKVKNLETGKVYGTIKEAARKLQINYSTLKSQLKNNTNPTLILL